PTSYVHGANQMACTGGGYVSKATNWGGTRIDLISATTSVTGNQRTVVFTVRPHSDYIELDAVNKISMYTTDYCGNVGGWTLFDANFSTMRVPSTPTGAATICTGGSATLTRGNAPPTGVTYYWQTSSTGTSTAIGSGATLVASPGSTTTYYIRPYSSLGCWGQASAGVTVTVVADPTISISANYSTICTGGTVTFTQSVSGGTGTITNQWQTSPDNSTWTNWTTTTNPSASPTANTYYRCQRSATGSGCDTYTSNVVFVTVTADPYFTTNPTGATICAGGSHYMTTVAAGGTGTLTYQWQYSDNGGSTWTNATGYTAVDITASPAATRMYRNTVSGVAAHGCSVNVASSPATITVVPDPTLSVPTRTNSVICQGGSTVYSSTLSNGTGSISYQWQYSPNNSVWSNVAAGTPTGAAYTNPTSTTMTVGGITANGTYYYRLSAAVSGTGCTNPVNSTGTTVQVVSDPSISISAGATSICYGLTAGLTASGSGGTGTMTYQWQYQNGATWVNTGSNSSSYTTAALSVTTRFRCLYSSTGSGCATSTSNVVTVNVSSQSIPPLSSSANPSTLCTGGSSTLAMAVPTTVTGGLLDYTTWTVGTGSATGFSQNGATSENNRISAADPWGNTTVIWEGGNDATSDADGGWNTGTITVDNTQLYRFSVWVNRTVLGNGSFYLGTYGYNGGTNEGVIRLSDGSNNTNPYFYSGALPVTNEWVLVVGYVYPNTYGGTTNHPESGMYTIAGGKIANTSSDYKWRPTTTATVHRTYLYYSTDISTRQRWIYPRIDLCDGTEPSINQLLNGFDSNRGLGSGASWQWYAGSCGGTSAGSGTSVVVSPTSTTNYYVRAVGTCNTTSCVNTSVTVVPDPTLSAPTRTNSIICQGGSTVYSSTLSNGTGTVTYQWQYSTDNVNYSNVVNGTPSGSSYTNPTATTMTVGGITANGTYYYRLSATTSGIGCTTPVNSTGATVQVVSDPTVAAATRTNSVVCQGGSTVYSSSVSNGTGTIAYQWQYSPDNVTFTNVVAGTPAGAAYTNPASTSMTVGGFTANGTYYYRLSATASGNGCASPVTGGASTVQVVSDPSLTAATRTNSIICTGGSSVYSSTLSNGTGTVAYQWQYSTDNVTYTNVVNGTPAGSNYTNPTAATMTVGGITVASTYYYRLSATSTGSGCTSPIVSTGSSLQVVADPTLTAATRTNSI
ncbi:MAG TPA: hypothetical protein PLP11_10825, partial [Bacteroidales bacterium]|nr:hypothetical protein [Bacteroidales bacterium]